MNQHIKTGAKVLAGVGALNLGLNQFVKIDLMSYVPAGMVQTIVIAAVAISGGALLYWTFKKE